MGDIFNSSKQVDNGDVARLSEQMKNELKDWATSYSIKYMDKIDAFLEGHHHENFHVDTTQITIQMALMYGFEVGFNANNDGGVK